MNTSLTYDKNTGLIPVVIQENETNSVLMLGYMNTIAFQKTLSTGYVYFWSRSRKRLWKKGETSGNYLKVIRIFQDCDADTLLIFVRLRGSVACHTGNRSCFFKEME